MTAAKRGDQKKVERKLLLGSELGLFVRGFAATLARGILPEAEARRMGLAEHPGPSVKRRAKAPGNKVAPR